MTYWFANIHFTTESSVTVNIDSSSGRHHLKQKQNFVQRIVFYFSQRKLTMECLTTVISVNAHIFLLTVVLILSIDTIIKKREQ